jgi:hypothetical protein
MRNIFFIIFFLFCQLSTNVFGQETINLKKSKYELASNAYGYLVGQEYSLRYIEDKYPQFSLNILKARLLFQSSFGKSKEAIKKYLLEFIGQEKFDEFNTELIVKSNKILNTQIINEDAILDNITEVEERAKGQIPSPILETLLSFQFSDRPEEELIRGFFTLFKTKGHPKSKNTDWQFKVPKSWKADEAERPNIIQKFKSDYGSGKESIMIIVKDLNLPKNTVLTKKDISDYFTESNAKEIVPEGGKFISFKRMSFDNQIGAMIEIETTGENLDYKFKNRAVMFMFIKGNKLYSLQGFVNDGSIDIDLTNHMIKFMPLFRLVANSIVLNDQYK